MLAFFNFAKEIKKKKKQKLVIQFLKKKNGIDGLVIKSVSITMIVSNFCEQEVLYPWECHEGLVNYG